MIFKHSYSLLVPCYNSARFVAPFLQSLNKLSKNFDEVIFYDDGSTDDTIKLLEKNNCRVIISAENKGVGHARNQLAEAASGHYLHFHDIDDFMMPNYLQKTAEEAENSGADVILCNVDWYNETQTEVLLSWHYHNNEMNLDSVAYTIANPIGGINGLYKKSIFKAVGGFNEKAKIWEDADLHVRLAMFGASFKVLEEVLCIAIRHQHSASSNQVLGWKTRLNFLKEYAQKPLNQAQQMALAQTAQATAATLVMCKCFDEAKQAFALSEQCGLKVPKSNRVIWRLIKKLLPLSWRIKLRIYQLNKAFN